MNKQIRINKDASVRAEELDGSGYLIGYASVFNEQTDIAGLFRESIAPGAFKEALERKDDTRVLFNHDPNLIIARSTNGTLEMVEDEKGLLCRIKLPNTTLGNDLRVLIDEGTISQMSFGFYIEKEERKGVVDGLPWFEIQSVRLFDVAPVTYPAYEGTSIKVARSLDERILEIKKAEYELLKKEKERAFKYRSRKIAIL